MHDIVDRTGVRLVLTICTDPALKQGLDDWYDTYGALVTVPGYLINAYRFDNMAMPGTAEEPQLVALYDIVTPDPATAWPDTEHWADYPVHMYGDPRRSKASLPSLRGSFAHVGSLVRPGAHGRLTGVHYVLSDGGDDAVRAQWASEVLGAGLFYAASRFTHIYLPSDAEAMIDGKLTAFPQPAKYLEVFETDSDDPLSAYERTLEKIGSKRSAEIEHRMGGSYRFYSAHEHSRNS